MSVSAFAYGTMSAADTAQLTARTVEHTISSGTATAGIRFLNTGVFQTRIGSGYTNITGEWLTGGTPGNYSVRRSASSGAAPMTGPAIDTWHVLSTSREWYASSSSNGLRTNLSTYDIRRDSDSTIVATANITLVIEVGFV